MHQNKYYLTEVDKEKDSVYCHHSLMGEVFIQKHEHEKGQFIYTEGGMVHIKTKDKVHYLPARHYMWIPPKMMHSIYPSSPKVLMRNLYFPVEQSDDKFYKTLGIYHVSDMLLQLLLFTKKWKGDIRTDNESQYPIVNAFKVLLSQISQNPLSLTLPKPKDIRLQKLVRYLQNNLEESIMFSNLAKEIGLSERSLHRLFKSDMNISFIRYYTLLRIFKAIEYLNEEKYTISEIAFMVGYSSVPTFSNTFYKILGKRPSDYSKGDEIFK
ncbi:AraC family transcriptional regulator [Chondrinema litorale]|uniref:AraC family transcriptional regulator n=1 Tax=Chondrinema litorale TaxID=2994555 RepID=UPI0025434DAD|nr:AraC family transcriptional regulator [Chondrinema litorale]UZR95404.1 AraC family transcriptional regulator [Chondrinema litorale]